MSVVGVLIRVCLFYQVLSTSKYEALQLFNGFEHVQ
jgi:hypothetical protein